MPKSTEPVLDADGALLVDLVSAAAKALEVNRDTINQDHSIYAEVR